MASEKMKRSTNRIQAKVAAMEKEQEKEIHLYQKQQERNHQVIPEDRVDHIHKQRKSLKNNYLWELYHQQLGHPSDETMENLHKYYHDAAKVTKPKYAWKCKTCHQSKFQKRRIRKQKHEKYKKKDPAPTTKTNRAIPGHGLHMDFGLMSLFEEMVEGRTIIAGAMEQVPTSTTEGVGPRGQFYVNGNLHCCC